MTAAITKLTVRTLIVAGVFAVVVAANYMRGVAGDTGTTFATYGVDLRIDSKAWYNGVMVPSATWGLKNLVPGSDKFWNFDDIKPGDYGCNVISLHVKNTNAWACLDFQNLQQNENGVNEPEGGVDGDGTGELADGMEFFGWDDIDGDGKYEPPQEKAYFGTSTQAASTVLNEKTYPIGDFRNGNMCRPSKPRYVGICWCAGNLTVVPGMNGKPGGVKCDATAMGNEAQTDSMSVDVVLRAEDARSKPSFLCGNKPPKPKGNNGVGNGVEPPPPGIGNEGNDAPGTGPGNPGGNTTAPGQGTTTNSSSQNGRELRDTVRTR